MWIGHPPPSNHDKLAAADAVKNCSTHDVLSGAVTNLLRRLQKLQTIRPGKAIPQSTKQVGLEGDGCAKGAVEGQVADARAAGGASSPGPCTARR